MPLKIHSPVVMVRERVDGTLVVAVPKFDVYDNAFHGEGPYVHQDEAPAHPAQQLGWLDEYIAKVGDFLTRLKGLRERVAAKPLPAPTDLDVARLVYRARIARYTNDDFVGKDGLAAALAPFEDVRGKP